MKTKNHHKPCFTFQGLALVVVDYMELLDVWSKHGNVCIVSTQMHLKTVSYQNVTVTILSKTTYCFQ